MPSINKWIKSAAPEHAWGPKLVQVVTYNQTKPSYICMLLMLHNQADLKQQPAQKVDYAHFRNSIYSVNNKCLVYLCATYEELSFICSRDINRLWNDLDCVRWGVKHYSNQPIQRYQKGAISLDPDHAHLVVENQQWSTNTRITTVPGFKSFHFTMFTNKVIVISTSLLHFVSAG